MGLTVAISGLFHDPHAQEFFHGWMGEIGMAEKGGYLTFYGRP
jgi:hypothetical protein